MTQRVGPVLRMNRVSMDYLTIPDKQDTFSKKGSKGAPIFNKLLHTAMKEEKDTPCEADISD